MPVSVRQPYLEHDLLTPTEVLDYLRVNVRTVYRLMRCGELPAVRVGRQWRVQRTELDAWLRRQQAEPPWDRGPAVARAADPDVMSRVPPR
jgi:excisionase family DNA binding protein